MKIFFVSMSFFFFLFVGCAFFFRSFRMKIDYVYRFVLEKKKNCNKFISAILKFAIKFKSFFFHQKPKKLKTKIEFFRYWNENQPWKNQNGNSYPNKDGNPDANKLSSWSKNLNSKVSFYQHFYCLFKIRIVKLINNR